MTTKTSSKTPFKTPPDIPAKVKDAIDKYYAASNELMHAANNVGKTRALYAIAERDFLVAETALRELGVELP